MAAPRASTTAQAPNMTAKARATAALDSGGRDWRARSSISPDDPAMAERARQQSQHQRRGGGDAQRAAEGAGEATAPLTAPRSRRWTAFWAATLQQGKIGPKPKPATINMAAAP
jgi:hypothetical protein